MKVLFDLKEILIVLACLAGGLGLGLVLEKIVLRKLLRASARTSWKGDDVIAASLRGMVIFLALLAGGYLSLQQLQIKEPVRDVAGKIIFSAAVLAVSVIAGRVLVGFIKIKTSDDSGVLPSTSIIANITRVAVFVVGVLVILQTFGISITPVLTALGVGGLAVALALQDTLSNLFAGIQVIASKQIRPGDYIKLSSGEEGYVADISWRNTIIRALSNNEVVVPNSKIASAIITNYHLPQKEMSVTMEIGVGYGSDLDQVEKVTIAAAKEVMKTVEGGLPGFEPFIRFNAFADSSINFTVIMRAYEFTSQYLIRHEFIKALYKAYRQHGIEIPFPVRTIFLKNAEQEGQPLPEPGSEREM